MKSTGSLELEREVAERLRQLGFQHIQYSPDLENLNPRFRPDIYAIDNQGNPHFIEVKSRRPHRPDLGQLVEYGAVLSKSYPTAKIQLICESISTELRDFLQRAGIGVQTFNDLGISPRVAFRAPKPVDLSPREQETYFALLRKGLSVVTYDELSTLISVSHVRAKNLLVALARKGAAVRVGRGKYVVVPADVLYRRKAYVADPLSVVGALLGDEPYFVGYASAAKLHGLATQLPFDTFVVLSRQKKSVSLGPNRIVFVKSDPSRYFGIEERMEFGSSVKISDLEKTVLDCLERPALCGGFDQVSEMLLDALPRINWRKTAAHIRKMKNKALAQRLGYLVENKHAVPREFVELLRQLRSPYFYPLDVAKQRDGHKSMAWRIVVNSKVPR